LPVNRLLFNGGDDKFLIEILLKIQPVTLRKQDVAIPRDDVVDVLGKLFVAFNGLCIFAICSAEICRNLLKARRLQNPPC